jgi:nucleoid-associated protein YgaU
MGIFKRILSRSNASPASESPAARPVARRTYLVLRGDNLWKIARRMYGDPNWWYEIFLANRRLVKTPDMVHAGMTLRLP